MSLSSVRARKTGWAHRSRPPYRPAASALALAFLHACAGSWTDTHLSLRQQLLARLGAVRPVEARLVGFSYCSLSNLGRPVSPTAALSAIVIRVEETAERQPSPGAMADLAIVKLLAGRPDAAVAALQAAVAAHPSDGGLQSDLAAALLAAGGVAGDPRSLLAAWAAADRAVQLAPALSPARFNRALALEKLQLTAQAHVAWLDCLRREPRSDWAAEVRDGIRRTAPASRLASWTAAQRQLQAAATAGDGEAVARLVGTFPQESRLEVQDRLLPAWADAGARGDDAGARRALHVARAVGAALQRSGGDAMAARSVAAIDQAAESPARLRRLRQGEQAYGAGLQMAGRQQYQAARAAFAGAAAQLRAAASPAALWAEVYIALCDYNQPAYASAGARLASLGASLPPEYPALRGRVLWLRGLIALVQGRFGESLYDYRDALDAFTKLHELENAGMVHVLLAENLVLLGEHAQAWRHRLIALNLETAAESPHLQTALQETAATCLAEDAPQAADRFEAEAIQVALRYGDPHWITEAYLRQIPIAARLGDRAGLAMAAAAVRRFAAAIPDRDLRRRLRADAIAAASPAMLAGNPRQVVSDLTAALTYYDSQRFSLPRAALLRQRAQAHLVLAEPALAEADVAASLAEVERQAARLHDPSLRLRMNAQALPILRDLTLLDWQLRRDPWTAFADAERARAYAALVPAPSPRRLPALVAQLPADVALLEFAVLSDRLLILSLTREGLQWTEQPAGAHSVAALVRRLTSAREARGGPQLRQCLQDLYDLLIGAAPNAALRKPLLVIVPDDLLLGVPFAALLSRTSHRYLLQDRTLMAAPSASGLALRRQPQRSAAPPLRGAAPTRTLIAGDPAFDRDLFAGLSALPASREEVRQLAALYPASTVLTGTDANESNVLHALPACEVAHFSAHAIDLADAAFLVLSPRHRAGETQDGTLSAARILQLDLHALHLVVLATCGKTRPLGQGWSLSRAFLAAGASNVIESLWPVDDSATAALMLDFHRLLRTGLAPVQALRQAQLRQLAAAPASSSLDWAAQQLVGTTLP
jgi:CHAT domain-containing protein